MSNCRENRIGADQTYPKWLGAFAVAAGAAAIVAGVVIAYTRFSWFAMAISMPASLILLALMLALGALMWRRCGGPLDTGVRS